MCLENNECTADMVTMAVQVLAKIAEIALDVAEVEIGEAVVETIETIVDVINDDMPKTICPY